MDSFVSLAFEQYPDEMAVILSTNEVFSTPEELMKRIHGLSQPAEMSFDEACTLDKLHDDYVTAKQKLADVPTEIPEDVLRILRLGKFANASEREYAQRVHTKILRARDLLAEVPKTVAEYTSWLTRARHC
jgi:hypothetical protein